MVLVLHSGKINKNAFKVLIAAKYTGVILDEKVFHNDFVNLAHNMGVFLHEDLLAIVSLRHQIIHILQIKDSGIIVDVRAIGAYCRDEFFLNSSTQFMEFSENNRLLHLPMNNAETGNHDEPNLDSPFLSAYQTGIVRFVDCGCYFLRNTNQKETIEHTKLFSLCFFSPSSGIEKTSLRGRNIGILEDMEAGAW